MKILNDSIIIDPFLKAYDSFSEALDIAKSDLEKAGCIQRFEFCYELSWKMLKRVLTYKGIDENSPRDVFRAAGREDLIDDPEIWFEFMKKRNLTTHTYNEDVAVEIYESLAAFKVELTKLKETLTSL